MLPYVCAAFRPVSMQAAGIFSPLDPKRTLAVDCVISYSGFHDHTPLHAMGYCIFGHPAMFQTPSRLITIAVTFPFPLTRTHNTPKTHHIMADSTQPHPDDPLFEPVNPDQQITEIESLCMNCEEQGTTRLLLTIIPHFREVVLMAFECPHCGYRNNEIQSATSVQELGAQHRIHISTKEDLSRQVVKSESASVKFEELDFEIPPGTQKGVLTTVEGLIQKSIEGLSQDQPLRKVLNEELYTQIESVIQTLQSYTDNAQPFTLTLNDPAGNSYIENLSAPQPDPKVTVTRYKRTAEQCEMLGLQPEEEDDDLAYKEQVHSFEGTCSRCHTSCETKMHMLGVYLCVTKSGILQRTHRKRTIKYQTSPTSKK